MFERFTDEARSVVIVAQDEARLLNHNWIGTEHVLLGLLRQPDGPAGELLRSTGISLEAARARVVDIVGVRQDFPEGHIPFTPRAKKVLELALREALRLGHNYIGTEHVLLGIIREGGGVAAKVLVDLGVDLTALRQQVLEAARAEPRPTPPDPPRVLLEPRPPQLRGPTTGSAALFLHIDTDLLADVAVAARDGGVDVADWIAEAARQRLARERSEDEAETSAGE